MRCAVAGCPSRALPGDRFCVAHEGQDAGLPLMCLVLLCVLTEVLMVALIVILWGPAVLRS